MPPELTDAHTVLLPMSAGLSLDGWGMRFLRSGGRALLLGESRDEYVARAMAECRQRSESGEMLAAFAAAADQTAEAPVLLAVDQELGGIQRLHTLVPALPSVAEAHVMSVDELVTASHKTAQAARSLGVTMFLAPVLDVLAGTNPWLAGRTLGADVAEVARIGAANIRGTQAAGIVATAKHFPGYSHLPGDPALVDIGLDGSVEDLQLGVGAFKAAIDAGVGAVMLGPATVSALDEHQPVATSARAVHLLRNDLGFTGLILTDDLDAPATSRGRTVLDAAIASLIAGADLLMLEGGDHLADIAAGINAAVVDGRLERARLHEAALRTRHYADRCANGEPVEP